MKAHFIAIGGSIMHALAIDLKMQGHIISGSDDEIYEPSRSQLDKHGLLPTKMEWDPFRIDKSLNVVVLGKHAKADNPELSKAQELKLKIVSFPEMIADLSKSKKKVVVAGSHGKTTTTSMIMHALKKANREFDYLVGARLDGFENMVKISDAPIIIIEGDENLSSAIDDRPKIFHYDPDITIITGIEWDHMNVFPTEEIYIQQFEKYIQSLKLNTILLFDEADSLFGKRVNVREKELTTKSYTNFDYKTTAKNTTISYHLKDYPVQIFGRHNMANMKAAQLVCAELGISADTFLTSMQSFTGAKKRQQYLYKSKNQVAILDFAHAPSKVKATSTAVKEKYSERKLIACLELHTYSSLNEKFLPKYQGSLATADIRFIFYNAHTFEIKGLPLLDKKIVENAFGNKVEVFTNVEDLKKAIKKEITKVCTLLYMTSGNFLNSNLVEWSNEFFDHNS